MLPQMNFACPVCHGQVAEDDAGWTCARHGQVGRKILGVADFTAGDRLEIAAGGVFDLAEDAEQAQKLAEQTDTFDELIAAISEPVTAKNAKYAERYARVETEAEGRHGTAIMDKIDAHLASQGKRTLGGARCLEAGGGHGKYLPGFATRFDEVVFVDISLTYCVAAQRYAEERGVKATFVRADVEHLPFPDGAFDFVHQNGVVEHVKHPDVMLAESLRVLAPDGVYACLSPNRFPITPEPHFRLPLFGIFPPPLRRWLFSRTRGKTTEAGTDLQSLRSLRALFRRAGIDPPIFFLPPRLPSVARQTGLRLAVQRTLDTRAGHGLLTFVNGPLLPVMPYHLAVFTPPEREERPTAGL